MTSITSITIKDIGDPQKIAEEIRLYTETCIFFEKSLPELTEKHPGRWVGLFHSEVVGTNKSYESLLKQIDEKNIPRSELLVRFLDPEFVPSLEKRGDRKLKYVGFQGDRTWAYVECSDCQKYAKSNYQRGNEAENEVQRLLKFMKEFSDMEGVEGMTDAKFAEKVLETCNFVLDHS